jgi:hypothetical protein
MTLTIPKWTIQRWGMTLAGWHLQMIQSGKQLINLPRTVNRRWITAR